jgi:hypothetical protein
MARSFTDTLTHDELAQKIVRAVEKNKGTPKEFEDDIDLASGPVSFVYENQYQLGLAYLTEQIRKDLGKVEFDSENHECEPSEAYCGAGDICGFRTLSNGLTYLGCMAGGDWETPLFYIIYWDGKKLRGYIPTDGNLWNTDTKRAYGNDVDGETDAPNMKRRFGVDVSCFDDFDIDIDCDKVQADILSRIKPKGGTRAEEEHDFDAEPDAEFDRTGARVEKGLKKFKFEGVVEAENESQAVLILVKNLGLLNVTEVE